MEVIDRDTIVYRDGRTSYVQHTNGHCYPNGPRGGYYLVTRSFGSSGLCRGDIAQVVDFVEPGVRGKLLVQRVHPVPHAVSA